MSLRSRRTAALMLLSDPLAALAQPHPPKLIDVHVHYNGEPGVLEKLLVKLNALDGLGDFANNSKGHAAGKHVHPGTSGPLYRVWRYQAG